MMSKVMVGKVQGSDPVSKVMYNQFKKVSFKGSVKKVKFSDLSKINFLIRLGSVLKRLTILLRFENF